MVHVPPADKSNTSFYLTAEAYIIYGSSSDLWELSWAYSDINNSTFGFALSANLIDTIGNWDASIDHIRITVSYTTP